MTQINFYSGSADKLATVCRLCTKAVQQGLRVIIYTPNQSLIEKLDQLLWSFSATSFIPHCRSDDEAFLIEQTPVILSNRIQTGATYDVLLNLHHQLPPCPDEFEKIIEITDTSDSDKAAARERYRGYKNAGFDIHHYPLDA